MNSHRHLPMLCLFALVLLFPLAVQAQTTMPQGGEITITQRTVTMTILPSGDIQVVEQWDVQFRGEPSSSLTYEIADNGFEAIVGWEVQQGQAGTPYQKQLTDTTHTQVGTYREQTQGQASSITWFFAPTTNSNETYTLRYTIQGAIRIYGNVDQADQANQANQHGRDMLYWNVVERQNRSYVIEMAQVTVQLPTTFDPQEIDTATYRYWVKNTATSRLVDGATVVFAADALRLGDAWEIRVQFPHGSITATPPTWQLRVDAERQQETMRQALLVAQRENNNRFTVLVAILIVVAGGVVNLWFWWRFARNKPSGNNATHPTELPEPLPAGMAGTLLHEHVESHEIPATLIDLAHRGYLRVLAEQSQEGVHTFILEQTTPHEQQSTTSLRPYEQTLLALLFADKPRRRLAAVQAKLFQEFARMKAELYTELVQAGYFSANPDALRSRFRAIGLIIKFLSLMGALFTVAPGTSHNAPLIFLLPLALLPFGLVLFFLSHGMHRTTAKGATTAAAWHTFKADMEHRARHATADEMVSHHLAAYLPYAVAFGIHQLWLDHLVSATTLSWYQPAQNTSDTLSIQQGLHALIEQVSSACDKLRMGEN